MRKQKAVLPLTTFAMTFSFAVWAVLSPLASTFEELYQLTSTEKSMLVAIPVLLGSIMRIPLGILTDHYGGRKMFTTLLLFMIIPLIGAGMANSYGTLLFWAFFIGMAGASFAVSIAFVSKLTPPEKQGTALGINAIGNSGTALAGFAIPTIAASFGVEWAFWGLIVPVVLMAILIWFYTPQTPPPTERKSILSSLSVLQYKHTWILSFFYFVTFGAFVALGIYLPSLLTDIFNLTPVDAGMRAAGFVVVATVVRPIGGIIADKIGGAKVLTIVFIGIATGAVAIAFGLNNMIIMTVSCLLVAVLVGGGNGAVFKLVPELFPGSTGAVTGIVGAWGGLGGFFPPILMGVVKDVTGNYIFGFILLGVLSILCLITNLMIFKANNLSTSISHSSA